MLDNTIITICGDLCPTNDTLSLFESINEAGLFNDVLPLLKKSDFVFGNLEFVLTKESVGVEKTGPILIGKPEFSSVFKKAGFDLLSLANNHIKDCGEDGVKSTMDTLEENKLSHFGAGKNIEEAKRPYITEINGLKIAFIAFAEQEFNCASEKEYGANYFDPYEDLDFIESVKKQVDFLFVIYHGGIEYYEYPSPLLQKKCRKFIDKGADLVTCQHSHCIGTIENYKDKNIVYGQGNTIFGYREGDNSWNQGLILQLKVENDILKMDYKGVTATKENGILLMTEKESQILKEEIEERSKKITDPKFIEDSWLQFCIKKESLYLPQYLGLNRYFIHLNRWTNNKLVSFLFLKKYLRSSHNIMRCEAHNEVIQTILNRKLKV